MAGEPDLIAINAAYLYAYVLRLTKLRDTLLVVPPLQSEGGLRMGTIMGNTFTQFRIDKPSSAPGRFEVICLRPSLT